jgi:hypothetical protein
MEMPLYGEYGCMEYGENFPVNFTRIPAKYKLNL